MKYLVNWIKKELNPDKHVSSASTTSEYFLINGARVRIGDHLGRDENDIQIIVTKDLFGKNKQFVIKESGYPALITVPDVKTVKVVLMTFLFHFSNITNRKIVQAKMKENEQKQLTVSKDTQEPLEEPIKQTKQEIIDSAIKKLCNNEDITGTEGGMFGSYMLETCSQWCMFSKNARKHFKCILRSGKTFDELMTIINAEFPEDNSNSWISFSDEEVCKIVDRYLDDLLKETLNSKSTTKCKDADTTVITCCPSEINESDVDLYNSSTDSVYKCDLKKLMSFYEVNTDIITESDKLEYYGLLGTLLSVNTSNMSSKLTEGQKKQYRRMLDSKIPYSVILKFFKKTMQKAKINNKSRLTPATESLKSTVTRFMFLYSKGFEIYPDDERFFKFKPLNDIVESISVNEGASVTTQPACVYDIPNIDDTFSDEHMSIIKAVTTDMSIKGSYNSYDTKRIMQVFSSYYGNIWDKLSGSQKTLCAELVTKEKMTLSETDFIINKIFDESLQVFPVTEMCKKYMNEYCTYIRNCRTAA